ncbi:MAG: two-component system, OmpR family, sensor histidine kinase KdpD [Solirubrobacteraceae bacterium]|nr:two-component system, OmpR family, sensor histidine kinase KdpD [Solirubrobacteraceae bacterium]
MAGRHKIFLGMAAGAGKTFRMLQEGHAEADLGRDVAIGIVESHGRADTDRLVAGLDVVPRRRVEYRGTTLAEMDLPAVLARRPELALIDELAHTNAPGLEHAKRYEDVADVLAGDIDVFSTLNVQHLESLNDAVFELTGVRVRETIPDRVLADADEVVLVDLTPQALVQRLREGKVYPANRVSAALNGFFKIENLHALREVALRQVAEEVEAKRLVRDDLDAREERLFGSAPAKPIAERLLALAKLAPSSERVVRRAWRSAQRLGAELDILVVRDPGTEPSAAEREQLESLRRIASALEARLVVEQADDLVDATARFAREHGTTYVFMGSPTIRRGLGRLGEPVAVRLMRALPGVDVRLVASGGAAG